MIFTSKTNQNKYITQTQPQTQMQTQIQLQTQPQIQTQIQTQTGNHEIGTELCKSAFAELLLKTQHKAIILKFGAEWCGPCKQIDPLVHQLMAQMPEDIKCYVLDIDDENSFDLYAFLKSKRMVNGVPVLLCYKQGNVSWVPNEVVVGANPDHVRAFFERCLL